MEFEITSFDDFLLLHDEKWHDTHNAYDFARSAWDEALKLAAKIAASNIPAPPTQWGKGAAYNADKIAKAIRAL